MLVLLGRVFRVPTIQVLVEKYENNSLNTLLLCADPDGGTGGPDPSPLKNRKIIGFLSNTGSDPLEIHKAIKPAFKVGPSSARQRNAI